MIDFSGLLDLQQDLALKKVCENSLIDFLKYTWSIFDPGTPLVHGYPLDAIAQHLEAVHYGHIKRLLINVPPGFSKSTLTNVVFPAWVWGPRNMPHLRFISASYAQHLSERDNNRCRRVIQAERYQKFWGDRFKLALPDRVIKFENDHAGWKFATSPQGIGTGERANCWIIDDPNSTMEVESDQVREKTNIWFTEVVPDRLNNMDTDSIIVIQQRLHMDDVSGICLSRDLGYTHLCIRMEYEPRVYVNAWVADENGEESIQTFVDTLPPELGPEDIFWQDWRTEDGELAWPERFSRTVCEKLKYAKSPRVYEGQYQQNPVPRGGAIIKTDWWQRWEEDRFRPIELLLASVDTAYTQDRANDPSAITVWGLWKDQYDNPRLMLVYAWEGYLGFHELVTQILTLCTVTPLEKKNWQGLASPRFPVHRLLIENKAAGISVSQELHRLLSVNSTFTIEMYDPREHGDKIARLHSIDHCFSGGYIWAPVKDWAEKVIEQCAQVPYCTHDDLADTVSMAVRWFRDHGYLIRKEESLEESWLSLQYRKPLPPLYPA